MGLGKTVAILDMLQTLCRDWFATGQTLIIAPINVAKHTWTDELEKWDNFDLTISKIVGTEKERIEGLKTKADIHIVNVENLVWLLARLGGHWPYDMLIVDESSLFKAASTARFKALAMYAPRCERVVLLTGTPAPNGIQDLWSQMYLLDGGKRLGRTFSAFKKKYLTKNPYSRKLEPKSDQHIAKVHQSISDICMSMKTKDYLELSDRVEIEHFVYMDNDLKDRYDKFKREKVLELIEDSTEAEFLTVANAQALSMKLRQFANGAVYDEDRNVIKLHDAKLDALDELLTSAYAEGENVVVVYNFKHDITRIQERFAKYAPVEFNKSKTALKDWNSGKIKLLLIHPASAAHGLNLQKGGNVMILFGVDWSLEKYQQVIKRLHRSGQNKVVRLYLLMTKGTVESRILKTLQGKELGQDALLDELKISYESLFNKKV